MYFLKMTQLKLTMIMNNYVNINSFSDLQQQEIRVRRRLKKQEEVLKERLKSLPEEIVTAGITSLIAGLLSGNIFKSAFSIFKTIGSAISESKKEHPESSGNFFEILKNIIKSKLSL